MNYLLIIKKILIKLLLINTEYLLINREKI